MDRHDLTPDRRNRRGASLVLTVVLLLGVLAVLALAIDLGMLFTARAEAQRAADSAALAAASAFQEFEPAVAVPVAEARAVEYAEMNHIRNALVTESEVTVKVFPDERLVRVWVRRDSLPTWFARLIGIPYAPVGAMAAAQAAEGGAARCLKPFALPDIWADGDDDANGNRLWDPGENWSFDPAGGDYYKRFSGPGGEVDETGYGSAWRDPPFTGVEGDYGREIQLKYTDPNSEFTLAPSMFLPWRLPEDNNMEQCSLGGGTGSTGAAVYRQNICSCNTSSVQLGVPYDVEPGNMLGPTAQGISELISRDPGAWWDPNVGSQGGIVGSAWGDNWLDSPRVVRVAMFDPTTDIRSGMQTITFNNFGLFFIEAQNSPKDPVVGRFLYYVDGDGAGTGPTSGSLVLYIRLVE